MDEEKVEKGVSLAKKERKGPVRTTGVQKDGPARPGPGRSKRGARRGVDTGENRMWPGEAGRLSPGKTE